MNFVLLRYEENIKLRLLYNGVALRSKEGRLAFYCFSIGKKKHWKYGSFEAFL